MKNIIRIFIFMLATSIIFTACNKDTSLTEVKTIDPTEQKILDFKAKMLSGDKSDETMSIEDAVWNIEAALNYTYCDNTDNVVGVESIFVNVNTLESGEIDFNEIINAYTQLDNSLVSSLGENTMRVADVEFVPSNNKSGDDESIKVTIVIVEAAPEGVGMPNQNYTIADDWYTGPWWFNGVKVYGGNCLETVTDKDLTSEIAKYVNFRRAVLANVYYTDIHWLGHFYSYADNEMDIFINNEMEPWRNIYSGYDNIELYTSIQDIWVLGSPSGEAIQHIECVDAARGNYHGYETKQALDYVQQYKMPNYEHVIVEWGVQMYAECRTFGEDNPIQWFSKHNVWVRSGIPHVQNDPIK